MCILGYLEKIFIIIGVFVAMWSIKADHSRRKKQATIDFYNQMSYECRDYIDMLDNERKRKTLLDYYVVNADQKLYDSVTWYLSRLERLAVGVAKGIFDFDTLNHMSGTYLIETYHLLKTYIMEERINDGIPTRYDEFEKLVKRIKKHRKKHLDKITDTKTWTLFYRNP